MVGNEYPDTSGASNPALTMARQQAAGLRALANMIERNPGLADRFRFVLDEINVPISAYLDDPRAEMATLLRAGVRAGATLRKEQNDKFAGAVLSWGPIGLHVYAQRDLVCERVVTGTETVTKRAPDPQALAAVPEVEVTEQVETVEWVCRPLLDSPTPGPDDTADTSAVATTAGAA